MTCLILENKLLKLFMKPMKRVAYALLSVRASKARAREEMGPTYIAAITYKADFPQSVYRPPSVLI